CEFRPIQYPLLHRRTYRRERRTFRHSRSDNVRTHGSRRTIKSRASLTELIKNAGPDSHERVGAGEDCKFGPDAPLFRRVIPDASTEVCIEIVGSAACSEIQTLK